MYVVERSLKPFESLHIANYIHQNRTHKMGIDEEWPHSAAMARLEEEANIADRKIKGLEQYIQQLIENAQDVDVSRKILEDSVSLSPLFEATLISHITERNFCRARSS